MKFRIRTNTPADKLSRVLPSQLARLAPPLTSSAPAFDVLIFGHAENDVSHSALVAKALARLGPSSNKLLAAGRNFTFEALQLLEQHNAVVLRLSQFAWSDTRHEDIKVTIGARIKRPPG